MYLGLDIGTSSVKAILIDADGAVVADASAALTVSRPRPAWSEQDPDAWTGAVATTLDALKTSRPRELAAVRGIGLSGQQHGATLLDDADKPLRPAILWNDGRAAREAAAMNADDRFRTIFQNVVFAGFTAPKLAWVAAHEPDIRRAVRWVLLPKDYVRLWLSGDHASDMSDASGTAWLDVAARRWSAPLLEATALSEREMPRLYEGTEATGTLRAELAARWGIAGPVTIAGGAGDNAASACGVGAIEPGVAFASLGTSGVLFTANEVFRPNLDSAVHAFCHALPRTWHQMGVILSAAASFEWLSNVLGRRPDDLVGSLGDTLRAPAGVAFYPYLSGERTPHNDPGLRGVFANLDHHSDAASLVQAVLEGVAFAVRDNLDALAAAGTHLDRVIAVGGGSRSSYWMQVLATVLGVPVDLPAQGEFGGALGAARLGLIAATGARPHDVCRPPAIARVFEPDAGQRAAFAEAYAHWKGRIGAVQALSQVTPPEAVPTRAG